MQTQFALDLSISLRGIVSQRLVPRKDQQGLTPAVEVLVNTPLVSKLIARQEIDEISEAMKASAADGMISFNRTIMNMFKADIISAETAIAVADNREEMKLLLEGMETGIDTLRAKAAGEVSGDA